MPSSRIETRQARGAPGEAGVSRDPDVVAAFLEDAAHVPGGHAAGVAVPASEADIAALVRAAPAVLPVGAQSSLTGGATPMGEIVLSTAKLNRILDIGPDAVRLQPGVPLVELDRALAREGRYYPPSPTFSGAFAGGTVATNAAGAATFKYGSTRDWVQALTVVLADGSVVDLTRGETRASDGYFEIVAPRGTIRVPAPGYRLPDVPKVSAGYFAAPGMDLIDLFIGSEGTLGVVSEITFRILPERPAVALAWVPFDSRDRALAFVARLRALARDTWRTRDPNGVDVSGIEHMDARSLALLRDEGADRANGVTLTGREALALVVTIELRGVDAAEAYDQIGRAGDEAPEDGALVRFCRLLDEYGVLDAVEIAVPGDRARADQLLALREAVPAAVNQRVGRAQREIDGRIQKTAADMIVPFDALPELFAICDAEFGSRGLDLAVWGHISDGNVHPNVIPRSYADVEAGKAAILAMGRRVVAMGGSPLAEHGVGRNPVKQALLAALYGPEGIAEMRRVKRALDPEWKLAPGVLFEREPSRP
jgi:D-lactate dehydrogenase (cytochrome)